MASLVESASMRRGEPVMRCVARPWRRVPGTPGIGRPVYRRCEHARSRVDGARLAVVTVNAAQWRACMLGRGRGLAEPGGIPATKQRGHDGVDGSRRLTAIDVADAADRHPLAR